MKIKKFLLGLLITVLSCFCICGITACELLPSNETGIYYLYEDGTYDKSDYLK